MTNKFENQSKYIDWASVGMISVPILCLSAVLLAAWLDISQEASRKSSDSISGQIVSINNTNYMMMREGVLYKLLPVKTNNVERVVNQK